MNSSKFGRPPRRYFLFVHYDTKEEEDFKWRGQHIHLLDRLTDRLKADLGYLAELLKPIKDTEGEDWVGRAFLFVDPGWAKLLSLYHNPAMGVPAFQLGASLQRIHEHIYERLAIVDCPFNAGCTNRNSVRFAQPPVPVQIVTARQLLDLLDILDRNIDDHNKHFCKPFLVGGVEKMRYDAPKVVEAVLRIANIGRQVPIFRFDDDVIFYGQREYPRPCDGKSDRCAKERESAMKEAQNSILKLCERYVKLSRNSKVHYFVFSGGYHQPHGASYQEDTRDLPAEKEVDNFDLINGFATRVVQLAEIPSSPEPQLKMKATVKSVPVMMFLRSLCQFGANPFRQVVSGAGLCLSDGAILDLPPFSNMQVNVMWIDDHLKYSLHHELGHFDIHIGEVGHARVEGAIFRQSRYSTAPTYEDVAWHLKWYMPRLILGCVADSWLRRVKELKQSLTVGLKKSNGTIDVDKLRDIKKLLRSSVPHCYAHEFMDVLPGDSLQKDLQRKEEFQKKLWKLGVDRVRKLALEWGKSEYYGTFLECFINGKGSSGMREEYLPSNFRDGLHKIADALPDECPELSQKCNIEDPNLQDALRLLVDGFVQYFEFVQFWKYFVYSVRFMLNQDRQREERPEPGEGLTWMFPVDEITDIETPADIGIEGGNSAGEGDQVAPIVNQ